MKTITVEFTGAARSILGKKTVALTLEHEKTYQDVVQLLGQHFPPLIGLLIDVDGKTFLSGNMFIIDGNLETPAFVMDEIPPDGVYLIIMSLVTGGSS